MADIELLRNVNQANKRYAAPLFADLEAGRPVKDEDLLFLEDFTKQEENRIRARDLMIKAQKVRLAPEETAFLEKFEVGLTGGNKVQTVDPRSGVPRVENVPERKSTNLEDIFAKVNLPEDLKAELSKGLAELAPIADTPIGDNGTVLSLYLKNKLGENNVLASADGQRFFIRPEGGGGFVPLPAKDILPSIARGATTFAGGVGGELLGSFGGLAGVALGGGAGSGLGEGININNAIEFAKKEGIVTGDEPSLKEKRNREIGTAAALGGFFGGGTGALKGAARGIGTALEEGAPLGKSISEGIRAESNTLAQGAANQARKMGLRGGDIRRLKGEVEQQGLSDVLEAGFKELGDRPLAGEIAQNSVKSRLNFLRNLRNQAFDKADQNFQQKLQKGNFAFIDMTDSYKQLQKELSKAANESPGAAKLMNKLGILEDIQNVLNSTKQGVLKGNIPSSKLTKQRFVQEGFEDVSFVTDRTDLITGKRVVQTTKQPVTIGEGFDPKQVTALDLRNLSNEINNILETLGKGDTAVPARLKKTLIQFKGAVDGSLDPSIKGKINTDVGELAMQYLDANDDALAALSVNNPFFANLKTAGRNQDIKLYKDAFKLSKNLHEEIPSKLKKVIIGNPIDPLTPASVDKALLKLDSDTAGKLKNIITRDQATNDLFEKAIEKKVYNKGSRESQRIAAVSPEGFEQALIVSDKEILEAQTKGKKPKLDLVKQTIIPESERFRELEKGFAGAKVKKVITDNNNLTTRVLLGGRETSATATASRLGAAQAQAQKKPSLFDTAIGAGGEPAAEQGGGSLGRSIGFGTGAFLGKHSGIEEGGLLGGLLGQQVGEFVEKQGARTVRPSLRFSADVLEAGRTLPLAPLKDVSDLIAGPNRDLTPEEIERQKSKGLKFGDQIKKDLLSR
jgi:hypothetical protein